jgi:diaminohydroxyphosphoribosylaminopyrimidine deaminase/5-amino-6-(5-phosphoribosylamino)uracil reductase
VREHPPERPITAFDQEMMRRALRLARRGEGRVEPNPMVGCVITRGDRILGEGYHERFGGPHAEIRALASCSRRPRGATVYVSLEPCAHYGKTPPCTDALIEAGVARVVTAMEDPNPLVRGRGLRKLRDAGIAAADGVLRDETAELLAPYLTRIRLKRPYVIAKWAQSLDGKLATAGGESRWISCEVSRRQVHRLRARVDAILVGSGTAVHDDPLLTARDVPIRRRAVRVVLDSRLRISPRSQLATTSAEIPTLVFTSGGMADSPRARRLSRRGLTVFAARTSRRGVDLDDCLAQLCRLGVTNLLVEGGPTVLGSFLAAGLVDETHIYVAPIFLGGRDAPGPLADWPIKKLGSAVRAQMVEVKPSGDDTFFRIRPRDPRTTRPMRPRIER